MPVVKPKRSKKVEKKEWAHVVDVNQELVNVSRSFRESPMPSASSDGPN